jgi:hypothetical protein
MAESGGNPNAVNHNSNGTVDQGLWQINSSNGALSTFDPNGNTLAAIKMSSNGTNWRPWCTAYSDGACGSKGGTYLGAGSPFQGFLANLSTIPSGGSLAGTSPNATLAAAYSANNQSAQLTSASGQSCTLKIPILGSCLWYPSWGRAALGGLYFFSALILGVTGLLLIGAKPATQIATFITPVGKASNALVRVLK